MRLDTSTSLSLLLILIPNFGLFSKISNVSVAASTISVDWFIPNENDDGYEDRNVQVGDTINFTWAGNLPHNVYIHPSQECSQDGAIVVGATSSNGDSSYTFQSSDVGKMTFACDVGSHCERGQILTVTVEPPPSPCIEISKEKFFWKTKKNGKVVNKNCIWLVEPPPSPCIEISKEKFFWKTKKNGKVVNKNCIWLAKKNVDEIENICAMMEAEGPKGLAKDVCQATCETCPSECFQATSNKFFYKMKKGNPFYKNCLWLSKRTDDKIAEICLKENLDPSDKYPPAMIGCPVTCESCGGVEPQ
eukprot:CAMPEP_0194125120 /NCGR_PEP_ID=MMETSP0150-20130528/59298_1 /TAXON_ID=122233 /ORGANISM="Chaetoceros debilis, Strain MM31A-1" /LENGTH=303 /DNA_ID=CAMNT_0038818913 /DNA_START=62 /DNA_END=973 /DNA_ORIENTATION=-